MQQEEVESGWDGNDVIVDVSIVVTDVNMAMGSVGEGGGARARSKQNSIACQYGQAYIPF